jgi:hypothetical protein
VNSTNGVFVVPAGKYVFISYSMNATDAKGNTWRASANNGGSSVDVPAGEEQDVRLEVGPPLKASIEAGDAGNGSVSLDLFVTGAGDFKYSIYANRSDGGVVKPGFRAVDSSGKTVWENVFEYG